MKHKLKLDALEVDSFPVVQQDEPVKERGTVRAHGTGGGVSCGFTCVTCYQTCWESCVLTCQQTCPFSCPQACATRS